MIPTSLHIPSNILFFAMSTQCDSDWQLTKKTVLERSCHMFNNPLMSDITFTCADSDKCFYAHKYVLATSSPVFYSMFYGDLAEKESIIHLPDTNDKSLEEFLRFLYTDQCTFTSEIAIAVMYLAKKYMVPSLAEYCAEVIQKTINPENAVTVLEQAVNFDEKELEEKCWEVVDLQSSKVVTSDAFNDISQNTLINLLKRNTLKIAEVDLFQALLNWSDRQCSKNGLETNGENRRAVIGEAINQIRFLSMTQKEFAQYVSSADLLKNREIVPIFQKLNGIEVPNFKWNQLKRQPRFQSFGRFLPGDLTITGSSWCYTSNKPDRLSFSPNEPATFHGVRLFGDAKGSQYEVSLEVNEAKVSGTYTSECNDEGTYGFDVMLPEPILLDKNKVVPMVANIKGPISYYGKIGKGKTTVQVDGLTVTFSSAPCGLASNGTDVLSGQFYQILLSKSN